MNSRPDLLYILAPSFSGSTLLTYLLAQHDEISTIGELKATQMGDVDIYRCSCGSQIRACKFWSEVGRRCAEAGADFSLGRFGTVFQGDTWLADKIVKTAVRRPWFEHFRTFALHAIPGAASSVRRIARHNLELMKIVCDLQGGSIFLDGSKDSVRLKHLVEARVWRVRVIYLQRDGRGVANSFKSHRNLTFDEAMKVWRTDAAELQCMRRRLDRNAVLDLHYEDLCRSPGETCQRIWQWLGIADQAIDTNFKQGDFHILGNAMRLRAMNEIRLDERWKSALSDGDMAAFERSGGILNRELGYE